MPTTNAASANNAFGTSVFTNPSASGYGVSQLTPLRKGTTIRSTGSGMFVPSMMVPGTIDVNNLASLDLLPTNARTLQLALRVSF